MDSCTRWLRLISRGKWAALRSRLLKSFAFAGYYATVYIVLKAFVFCLTLKRFKSWLSTLSELETIRFTKRSASHSPILWSLKSSLRPLSVSESFDVAAPSRIVRRPILVASWAYLPVSILRRAIVCCLCFLMNLPKSISLSIWEAALSSLFR